MDYFIIAFLTFTAIYFHWWLFVRFKRWGDRDLALSLPNDHPSKKSDMLEQPPKAQSQKIKGKQLQAWLEQAASNYR